MAAAWRDPVVRFDTHGIGGHSTSGIEPMATNRPVNRRDSTRLQTLTRIALFLGGFLIPLLVLSLILLLHPSILVLPKAIEISILVINCLQLVMQIIQFVFIVHQIFVWKNQTPP